jgi:phospholipid/cholesterol/gamma-HCH transport system substrate-binding protein
MDKKRLGYVPGLIAFVALVIFFGSILWLSGKAVFITPDYRYYFEFDDVVGLRDKAPVYMRGYRVGWTKAVEFMEDTVRVTVDIKKRFRFPEDSQIEISTLNFIGEKAVTIRPGSSSQNLEPRATLRGTNKDLMTLAAKILSTAQQKIEAGELDQVIQKVSSSMDGVLDAVQKMKAQMERLDVAMYNRQIRRFGEASEELKTFMAAAQQDTRRVAQTGQESLERFNHTLEEVDGVLGGLGQLSREVRAIAQQLNRGEGTAGQLLQNKDFFDNLNRTIAELNEFLADIKKNPKKYVKFSIF